MKFSFEAVKCSKLIVVPSPLEDSDSADSEILQFLARNHIPDTEQEREQQSADFSLAGEEEEPPPPPPVPNSVDPNLSLEWGGDTDEMLGLVDEQEILDKLGEDDARQGQDEVETEIAYGSDPLPPHNPDDSLVDEQEMFASWDDPKPPTEEETETAASVTPAKPKMPSGVPRPSLGMSRRFNSSSADPFNVSSEALERARKLFEDCDPHAPLQIATPQVKVVTVISPVRPQPSPSGAAVPPVAGFQTASGAKVKVSDQALNQAKALWDQCQEEAELEEGSKLTHGKGIQRTTGATQASLKEGPELKYFNVNNNIGTSLDPSSSVNTGVGFQTGCGAQVKISNKALNQARELWKRVEDDGTKNDSDGIRNLREEILRTGNRICLLYTSPSPRDRQKSRMPSSA